MKFRRGVSLAELLVVMSLCSLLLTTSAVVLHRMMHSQHKTQHSLAAARNGLRLADQFRRDAHLARTVTTEELPENVLVKLQISDQQTAQYEHAGGIIRRLLFEGEQTVAREEYAFPAGSQVAIAAQTLPPLLRLSVINTPGGEGGPAQQAFDTAVHLRIDAQPGLEKRFTDVSSQQEAMP
jgi:type II secretory pathway component PulJ